MEDKIINSYIQANIQHDPQSPDCKDTACKNNTTSTEEESLISNPTHESVTVSRALLKCKWKNITTAVCLWLTYLFINVNYSLIGPLFPSEVINI